MFALEPHRGEIFVAPDGVGGEQGLHLPAVCAKDSSGNPAVANNGLLRPARARDSQ